LILFTLGLVVSVPAITVFAAVLGLTAPFIIPNKIEVGRDGVLIRNRLDTEFYSYDEIRNVTPTNRGVTLELRDDRKISVPITSHIRATRIEADQRSALVARIEEGRRAYASDARADIGWRLERGEKSVADWLRHLDAEADFRNAPLRAEDLVTVLESHASPTARLAAARLLVKRGGEEERARIRVAAEACAAPKLRVAMETVASDADEEAIEQAFDAIES
jgi:hypothetical protein